MGYHRTAPRPDHPFFYNGGEVFPVEGSYRTVPGGCVVDVHVRVGAGPRWGYITVPADHVVGPDGEPLAPWPALLGPLESPWTTGEE
jgi:hypothetical protein